MRTINALSKVFERSARFLASIILLLIMVLMFGEVISRFIFNTSHDFVPVFSAWFMVWIVYLMMGVNSKNRQDIMVDIITSFISKRTKTFLVTAFDVVGLIFGILLCIAGTKYTILVKEMGLNSLTLFSVPTWIATAGVIVSGILLIFFYFEHLLVKIFPEKKYQAGGK
jgi:C4-dicarboxylate transporter DctQ subunit